MNMHVYNVVWNCDGDDGFVNDYEHVWKYMMIVIDHKHDVWHLEFNVDHVCGWKYEFGVVLGIL